jgi:serine/threonine protein kinase
MSMSSSVRAVGVGRPRRRLDPGAVLGERYVVERVVSDADPVMVVEATRRDLDQPVVLKILGKSLAAHEPIVQRFLAEAKRAGSLKSAHAVRVIDVGRLPSGEPYFATERLDGAYLHMVLAPDDPALDSNGKRFKPMRAAELIAEACDAVAEMHARGWVHGDLKPRNLFLETRSRGEAVLKVCDSDRVGLLSEIERVDASLTPERLLQGESLYLSPEQLDPRARPEPRADVWSLGAIFYEMLTGRPPFDGETLPQSIQKVSEAAVITPSHVVPGIPPAIDDIVISCLQKDPRNRYADAAALRDAIDEAFGDRSDTALMDAAAFERESETEIRPSARPDRETPTSILDAAAQPGAQQRSWRPLPSVSAGGETTGSLPSVITSSEPSSRALHVRPHPLAGMLDFDGESQRGRPAKAGLPRVVMLVMGLLAVAALITFLLHKILS